MQDGRSCEEWALFRDGTCSDGSKQTDNLTLGLDSDATLGTHLIAYNGMTLYTYSKDEPKVSNCIGQCAANWPPYTFATKVGDEVLTQVQHGVIGAIGLIDRADGSYQVTYNDMPLYFYSGDKMSGDIKGQAVGNVWFVVKP